VGRRHRQEDAGAQDLPLVALVGRPNVGKSSLFNRLVGGRPALVEDVPGVTRDRRYGVCDWGRARFRVVDTGGLDPSAAGILGAMRAQTLRAVEEGAVLVFVVDVREGITAVDEDVAQLLRRTGKPVFIAANKADSDARTVAAGEVFRLGFEQVYPVSATHGRGMGELLDAVVAALGPSAVREPQEEAEEEAGAEAEKEAEEEAEDRAGAEPEEGAGEVEEEAEDLAGEAEQVAARPVPSGPIRVAFVGKPNVGKSSLVNRLLGEERVLVHHEPGTTRDPIDTPFRLGEQDFVLVDTAGVRRRRSIDTLTEAVAAKMARDQLARADVAALVIDIERGATAEDAKLASIIEESGRATVIVLNKSDLIPRAELDARIQAVKTELAFVSYAPHVLTSARTGRAVLDVPAACEKVFNQWSRRVSTADLNRSFDEIVARRPPPAGPAGRHVKLYYATQADVCPPTFFISVNQPKAVGAPYRRYLVNQLRAVYGFAGSPIRVVLRAHRKPART
jgi:GTPase